MPSIWILGLAGVLSSPDAASLHHDLARMTTGIRVMYVAAHPDDEHSELLAYLAGGRHAQVAYLSLTRGSGGQNRIGSEQGPALGVLRTQELLAAREFDRAEQLFTRALDFGYSKSAEETLAIWGDDAILDDVVYAIRAYRPHVIITRFPESGDTHGHHLASARLARRAFTLAADESAFPHQLSEVGAWQATRLVHDVPTFMQRAAPSTEGLMVDTDGFDPWRGRSHGEIAAQSRSQHRSQGFGSMGRRGTRPVRMVHLEGTPATADLLEGIEGDWSTLDGGAALKRMFESALEQFDPSHPERTVPALIRARRTLSAMPPSAARDPLLAGVDALIVGCAGLYVDVRSAAPIVFPGAPLELSIDALSRSPLPVRLESATIDIASDAGRRVISSVVSEATGALDAAHVLTGNTAAAPTVRMTLPGDASPSVLPWLAAEPTEGHDRTEGRARLAAWPEPSIAATLTLTIDGERITVRRAVRHVRADTVLGERAREVEVHPALLLTPERSVALAAPGGSTTLRYAARGAPGRYEVALEAPEGWASPAVATLELGDEGHGEVLFEVTASSEAVAGIGHPTWRRAGEGAFVPALEGKALDYPHVPERVVLQPARTRLLPIALRSLAGQRWRVGYVEGTGDDVGTSLTQAGMQVVPLDLAGLGGDLSGFDAIVVGVRAFNRWPELHERHAALMAYVERGGTMIVQYQTVNRLEALSGPIGPAPLTIERGRVTDQNAEVELLAPEHPALTTPHRIGPADFEGWVQERGLYFAEEWDAAYTPLLRMADPGEEPADGALLVASHGRGHFVYAGVSFFRQLPAGTAGAYRLFENLIALGTNATAEAPDAQASADAPDAVEAPPPFGGTWTTLYVSVAGFLLALIGVFFYLSRRFG